MNVHNHTYVIILAGGIGKRFQPYSTPDMPKQFLNITNSERTMIQETYDRVTAFANPDHLFVSTNDRYRDLVAKQLPNIPRTNVIGEPKKKNTAPAIALISYLIYRRDPKAVTMFLPSDHFIAEADKAVTIFKKGIAHAASKPVLVTFGIIPTFASPEFGYIHRGKRVNGSEAYEVIEFVEKPDVSTAEKYIALGGYYWNGGMFVWNAATLIEALTRHEPAMAKVLETLKVHDNKGVDRKWLETFFEDVKEISIDYAVMEKANNVNVIPFDCGWSDVGTWEGLADLAKRFHLVLPQEVREHLKRNS